MNRIVGVIPAKGSSSRVPDKNRQLIRGVPLFLWACNNLNRVLDRSDIYVDSDSAETRRMAEAHGFQTMVRPAEMATNATDGNALMRWEASNVEADIVVQHLPPMIFLKETTLRRAIDLVVKGEADSVFGAAEEAFYLWDEQGPRYDIHNIPNSFTLPKLTIEGMGIYVTRKAVLMETGIRVGGNAIPMPLDKLEQVDIDYLEDLEMARALACGLPAGNPYTEGVDNLLEAKPIRLLVIDVDGTMTDGGMYVGTSGEEMKKFNTKDGIGIQRALKKGVEVAFLSSGVLQELMASRAKVLGVKHVSVTTEPKIERLRALSAKLSIPLSETAFIGDDINDVEAMKACGFSACPADSVALIKSTAHVVLNALGGGGCVREFVDRFIISDGKEL